MTDSDEHADLSMRRATLLKRELLVDSFKKVVRERLRIGSLEFDWIYLDKPKSIVIIALTPDYQLVLVKQYRYNLKQDVLEVPAGVANDADKNDRQGAIRELREETGYTTKKMIDLGTHYVLPSETNRRIHFFLAVDAIKTEEPRLDDLIEKYFDMSVEVHPLAHFSTIADAKKHGMDGVESLFGIQLAREYLL